MLANANILGGFMLCGDFYKIINSKLQGRGDPGVLAVLTVEYIHRWVRSAVKLSFRAFGGLDSWFDRCRTDDAYQVHDDRIAPQAPIFLFLFVLLSNIGKRSDWRWIV